MMYFASVLVEPVGDTEVSTKIIRSGQMSFTFHLVHEKEKAGGRGGESKVGRVLRVSTVQLVSTVSLEVDCRL